MNVAHATATFPPYWAGTGNVAFNHALALHHLGHSVTVLTAASIDGGSVQTPFDQVRLKSLFSLGNAPMTPGLVRHAAGFDILHLHVPFIFGAELLAIASRLYRTPMVITYHNQLSDPGTLKDGLFRAYNLVIEPTILRRARRIIAVRRSHLISIHPSLGTDNRVCVVPNGVDTQVFRPVRALGAVRAALQVPSEAKLLLFVAALDHAHRSKNLEGLLRAVSSLPDPRPYLVVVGDGSRRTHLHGVARSMGLASQTRFVGSKSPSELAAIYSAADVTVLPSISQESFGLVLLESLACGTPVVASRLPGVSETVEDGHDGLLVTSGDDLQLRDAILKILGSPTLARAMGAEGQRRVRANYTWTAIAKSLEQVYLSVLTDEQSRKG